MWRGKCSVLALIVQNQEFVKGFGSHIVDFVSIFWNKM